MLPRHVTPSLHLEIDVKGHEEVDGCTYYELHCAFTCKLVEGSSSGRSAWISYRRLSELREELHSPIKATLTEKSYGIYFGATPFARRGGVPGTTARLDSWCRALAQVVSTGELPPAQVINILKALGSPVDDPFVALSGASFSNMESDLSDLPDAVEIEPDAPLASEAQALITTLRLEPSAENKKQGEQDEENQKRDNEEEDDEEDDEESDDEANERRKAERERRRRLNEDLKERQAHDKAMAEQGRLQSSLERRKADLLKQLQTMSAAAEEAEAECERLQNLQDHLQREVDMKSAQRNLELESRKNAAQTRDQQESDGQQKLASRHVSTGKSSASSTVSLGAQPIDRVEIMRRIREIMKAVEADQARERAKLQAKIKELEEAIARLKRSDLEAKIDERSQNDDLLQRKQELETQLLLCKVKADRRKAAAGEAESLKEAAPKYKARRIFERLHEDASDRVTRFVVRKGAASGNDNSNKFRMEPSKVTAEATGPVKSVSCVHFSSAEAQLSLSRRRATTVIQTSAESASRSSSVPKITSAGKPMDTLGSIGEGTRCFTRRTIVSNPPIVVESSSRPSSAAKIASIGKPMDALARSRRASSATSRPEKQNKASMQKLARPTEECGVLENRSEGSLHKTLGPIPTQFGASVLYSRTPTELAGPTRKPLLRTTLEQHHQDVAVQSMIAEERPTERD